MITFMEPKEKPKEMEKCLDSQLWHACAGGMVQMPAVNSKVFYFPQGHAEHSCGPVDFRNFSRVPPYILCRVSEIKFMADPETDEVFAKMRLTPICGNELNLDGEEVLIKGTEAGQDSKPASFAKTLTQSDANNGGGFSVPRYCAETIFPRLDYSVDPPVQNILAKDVHGETWKFRHIYRGTPRRHLLTSGWSTFVNNKKLVAGDSIVFLRAENGDLCIGIRRAKRGIAGGPESSWNPAGGNCAMPYGGMGAFFRKEEIRNANGSPNGGSMGRGKVRPESVIEAASLAARGQPFEVVYYPRASTPEFCVKASLVNLALQIHWCSGMRFKMAFETEDSSRISWFMGTISSIKVADLRHWPNSPWRMLQVTWDEPDLLQNVKCVSPWLVELVSSMPPIQLTPFSPPRKKLRLPQHPNFPLDGQFPMQTFSGNLLGPSNPFGCLPNTSPVGMQGARHAHYSLPLSDLHLNKLQTGLFPAGFSPLLDHASLHPQASIGPIIQKSCMTENGSCILTMGHSAEIPKKPHIAKTPSQLVLFGQQILTEQQISLSGSGDSVSPAGNSSSEGNLDKDIHQENEPYLETGHCKVFMESEEVGRTLDLSLVGSYEELYRKLARMFGIENYKTLGNVIYRDVTGAAKHIKDEPFSDFIKRARRLTIEMDTSSDNGLGR